MLLLGYLGIFESTTLDPYLEIANKLRQYLEVHKGMTYQDTDHLKAIRIMMDDLETSLKRLTNPSEKVV